MFKNQIFYRLAVVYCFKYDVCLGVNKLPDGYKHIFLRFRNV